MKKIFIPFVLLFLFYSIGFGQTINEKEIASFPGRESNDIYSFRYHSLSGTYLYAPYDTLSRTSLILSNKGNSKSYAFVNIYSAIFDRDGNYYVSAGDNLTDTTYKYYFLKNGEVVSTFGFIDEGWTERDGVIYFSVKDGDKSYFVTYNIAEGKLKKSKPYDDVKLIYFKDIPSEGEPVGQIGFTPEGKSYFLAESNNEKFIVVGGEEQKHYSDIDYYYTVTDRQGVLVYIARDKGKFYESKGNTFVVQGSKEYNSFDYIYGPIIFDKGNNPVYAAADSAGDVNPQRVMVGNTGGKIYNSGIYDLKFTSSGKLAYAASTSDKEGKIKSMIVIDGKEGKKYLAVYSLNFGPGDEPVYAASNEENKYFVVAGKKEMADEYDGIFDPKFLSSGKVFYVGVNYGNYEKKKRDKYYLHIGEDQFGPYDGLEILDYIKGSYIATDNAGNYAYVSVRLKSYDPYISKQTVRWNKGKSEEFDFIQYVNLYKGEAIYTGSKYKDASQYVYTYKIFHGLKQIGSEYDGITDYVFENGKITFIGFRNQIFYRVTITL